MGEVTKLKEEIGPIQIRMGHVWPGPNGIAIPNFLGPLRKLMSYNGYRNQGLIIRLIKLEKFIAEQMDIFAKAHEKLLEKYQAKDENGKPKVVSDGKDNHFEITDRDAFEVEWKELLAQPIETDIKKFPLGYFLDADLSPNEFAKLSPIIAFPDDSSV